MNEWRGASITSRSAEKGTASSRFTPARIAPDKDVRRAPMLFSDRSRAAIASADEPDEPRERALAALAVLVALVVGVTSAHKSKKEFALCTPLYSKEYIGNDVVAPISGKTLPRCCDECAKLKNCSFFAFNVNTNLCSFKSEDAHTRTNAAFISGYVGAPPPAPPVPTRVNVGLVSSDIPHWTTGDNFVCWNIDASAGRGFFWRNLSTAAPFGAQLARQAAALGRVQEAGHSMLRFGGTGNDYLTYSGFGTTKCRNAPSKTNKCLNRGCNFRKEF